MTFLKSLTMSSGSIKKKTMSNDLQNPNNKNIESYFSIIIFKKLYKTPFCDPKDNKIETETWFFYKSWYHIYNPILWDIFFCLEFVGCTSWSRWATNTLACHLALIRSKQCLIFSLRLVFSFYSHYHYVFTFLYYWGYCSNLVRDLIET